MRLCRYQRGAIVALVVSLMALPAFATTVMQLNLAELVNRADKIYRGTVVAATEGTVDVGGTQLPIVTYQVRVDETLVGEVPLVKGVRVAEIRMVGKIASRQVGNLRHVSPLPEIPRLAVGQTYLLFATRPSKIGLSTTVGLGQGTFAIFGSGKDETALNAANNSGLYRDMAPAGAARRAATATTQASGGPVAYAELASQIRSLAAGRE